MNLRDKSYEELLDVEQELHDSEDEYVYSRLVQVYKEMHKRLRVEKRKRDDWELKAIEHRLVKTLVEHGTYLKTIYRKNDDLAEQSLQEALRYNKNIPIAHYRLGFLLYKRRSYSRAVWHFQHALDLQEIYDLQEICVDKKYLLHEQQKYYTHLYLINSSLQLAIQTHMDMRKLTHGVETSVQGAEISPLYDLLKSNEQYLDENAYYRISRDSKEICSQAMCMRRLRECSDVLQLYFGDKRIELVYRGKKVFLGPTQGEALKYLLLHTKKQIPATRQSFYDINDSRDHNGEVRINSFIRTISRLKEKMGQLGHGVEDWVISTNYDGETAYYIPEKLPYCMMYRVDK